MPSNSGSPTAQEAALAQETAQAQALLEAAPDALVGVDRRGVIRFVNRQTEVLFGYDRGELVGTPLETLVPESLRQVHRAHRAGYNAQPSTRPMAAGLSVSGRRRDGAPFPVDIALSYLQTADGPLIVAAVHDMTSYRRDEEERRRVDRVLAGIEHSEDAIIGKTLEGIVTSWNPAAERMYGYTSEMMVGKSMDALIPKDRTDEMKSILAGSRAGQSVDHLQTVCTRKNGTAITISLSVTPTRGRGGTIIGASTTAHDLTEQLQAFQAARSMIEASLDSLVAISPEGKITDANQATVNLTGVPRDQLIGTAFSDYFTDPAKAEAIYQKVFSEGMAVDYPLTLRHQDGHETLTDVLYNASVYRDGTGNVLGVFAAARDVTNQMQAQREIAEQQAAALDRLEELERFQRLTVGRELKMVELKKEIEYLRKFAPTDGGEPKDPR